MNYNVELLCGLLLSYVSIVSEIHCYAPGDGFEFLLWDDLLLKEPTLVDINQKKELVDLIIRTNAWVVFNFETKMMDIIDIDSWRIVLKNRNN